MGKAMEEIYERTLLFDFYGELLTPHRREIYSTVVFDDMSLSEAAEAFGVSAHFGPAPFFAKNE